MIALKKKTKNVVVKNKICYLLEDNIGENQHDLEHRGDFIYNTKGTIQEIRLRLRKTAMEKLEKIIRVKDFETKA